MSNSNRYWALIAGMLCSALAGSAVAGSPAALEGQWRDPYTLSLPSPEQYRLGTNQVDIATFARNQSTSAPESSVHPFQTEIVKAANEFKIDPALVHAVIQVESGYNAGARSLKGAQGLMQLLPETASRFGVASADLLWKPERNIHAGVAYLSSLLEMFGQDLALVLAAYNAGENAVLRYGRKIPPFPETRDYVPKVLAIYRRLRPLPEPEPLPATATRIRIQYPPPLPEAQPETPAL